MIAASGPKGGGRGKSGLHRAGCRITSGGGDSKESATEIYRHRFRIVRITTEMCTKGEEDCLQASSKASALCGSDGKGGKAA